MQVVVTKKNYWISNQSRSWSLALKRSTTWAVVLCVIVPKKENDDFVVVPPDE